jgi:hypothetical protein
MFGSTKNIVPGISNEERLDLSLRVSREGARVILCAQDSGSIAEWAFSEGEFMMTRSVWVSVLLLTLVTSVSGLQDSSPRAEERHFQADGGLDLPSLHRLRDVDCETHVEYHKVTVPKGNEVTLADLKGPGKVTYWYITDDTGGKWYPGLVLKIYWDQAAEPSVNVPLSDFFGAMNGRTIDYQSTPLKIQHFCYMCVLPMPFATGARFVLANDGDHDYSRSVAYGIDYEKDPQYARELSRLHTAWRRSNPVERGLHTILDVKGRGHYVGNFLQVETRFKGWWGEGDTIFHINSKKVTHSPGTEDEYGACWGFGNTFSYLDCGYLENDKGKNRMYRFYLANPVRFRESLKVEIQNNTQTALLQPTMPTTTPALRTGTRRAHTRWRCRCTPSARLRAKPRRTRRQRGAPRRGEATIAVLD